MRSLFTLTCCILTSLAHAQLPAPSQTNPFDTPRDAELGGRLFQNHCSYCHGVRGEGGRGADLTNGQYRHGGSDTELYSTIRNGIRGTEMPAVRASDDEVWRMVAFVKRIGSAGLDDKVQGDAANGRVIYGSKGKCAGCHAIGREGGSLGPALTDIGRRRGAQYLEEALVKPEAEVPINYRAIRVSTKSGQTVVGIRLNEDDLSIQLRDTSDNLRSFLKDNLKEIRRDQPSLMPAYGSLLSRKELTNLVAYFEFFARRTMTARFLMAVIVAMQLNGQGLPVPYERLSKADREPGNWLMYSSNYNSWRFSKLDQINAQNVNRLHVKWLYQARLEEKFETTPLVVDGIMYLTRPENEIHALDAETGRVLWTYTHRNPPRTFNCCGKVNRGLAILDNRLFMNTLDMHVLAVDAKSGRELWKTKIHDHTEAGGYAATGAPLALNGKVIVGMAGGEHGVSGFLDAYDAATGKRLWRFNTIPQPDEPNFGTWAGDSWKTGGASTWNNGSYDPELNLVYWGTSNPWPDYNGDFRAGDNLYSCSVIALDADTGKLKWHYQFTPHDLHDWDATQIPVLLDGEFRGRKRKLMAWANRNGFFYLLDRATGEFLLANNFVKQTWVKAFDDKGRPEVIPGTEPTPEGSDNVWPGVDGGANWMSRSYSPLTKLMYVFAREERRVFTKGAVRHPTTAPEESEGRRPYFGRRAPRFAPEESWGKVVAIDPPTGAIKWEHKVVSPPWSGVMATAGNLVFGGTLEGVVFALDARTGKRLWYFAGNDRVYATPISFLAGGKQLVSLPVGDVLITFGLD